MGLTNLGFRERANCKPEQTSTVEKIPSHYFSTPYDPDAVEEDSDHDGGASSSNQAGAD